MTTAYAKKILTTPCHLYVYGVGFIPATLIDNDDIDTVQIHTDASASKDAGLDGVIKIRVRRARAWARVYSAKQNKTIPEFYSC